MATTHPKPLPETRDFATTSSANLDAQKLHVKALNEAFQSQARVRCSYNKGIKALLKAVEVADVAQTRRAGAEAKVGLKRVGLQ